MEQLSYAPYPVIAALFAYLIAAVLGALRPWLGKLRSAGAAALVAGLALTTLALAARWNEAGRAPFKTVYETLVLLAWCIAAMWVLFRLAHRAHFLTPLAAAGAFGALFYATTQVDVEVVRLPPALQSGWFVPHVVTYFVAYAALALSALAALVHLAAGRLGLNAAKSIEAPALELTGSALNAGFTCLSFGLAMGCVWGKVAWGDYWSWDPKENWALISWLVYLTAVHLRYFAAWHGRRFAWLSLGGFAIVMFTYLGMHLLPTSEGSLHVYQ